MYDGLGEVQDPGPEGHRQRLRRRFLAAGADALADYELIELLLMFINQAVKRLVVFPQTCIPGSPLLFCKIVWVSFRSHCITAH